MNKAIGDELTDKGVNIYPGYGSTETGFMNVIFPREPRGKDWEYFEFTDHIKPGLLDDGDGHFEMHLIVGGLLCVLVLLLTFSSTAMLLSHSQRDQHHLRRYSSLHYQ
jgi:hypothetical protein